ncbi:MAG TPA: tetratricopeptide repeat protein [Longimicrobiaceae bacterium]|nr:tetratricopeptide repeat protein [Longimicrobiaceae bacterium]
MSSSFLSSEEYDEKAHQLYDAGEYDQALELLGEALRRYPGEPDLHVGLGYVRLAREEYAWARRSFARALEIDAEHEDGWVGLGETHLKFGRIDEALRCFDQVDELGVGDDHELGLAIGRALYREGLHRESCDRLAALAEVHADSAEVRAALGYALHALGDEAAARKELREALHCDPALHEVRIYLSHLLFERGDMEGALREMQRVPPSEHWDPLSLWRFIDLKCSLEGCREDDPALAPWRERWLELQIEPDPVDHLLAEIEADFDERDDASAASELHRVRTADGRVFSGTWEEIVRQMRDALAEPGDSLPRFMRKAAQRARKLTGYDLPCNDAESFVRESARLGLLRIED